MTEPKAKPKAPPKAPPKAKSPPPEADQAPRPKSGYVKKKERKAAEIVAIEAGFAELLTLPAMGFAIAGDKWAVDHFTERGPSLASRIAAECERNDRLRSICMAALSGQSIAMLGVELFMYAGLPAMHLGLIPGAEQFGVPVVRRKAPAPAQTQPHAQGGRQAPAPDPDANGGARVAAEEPEPGGINPTGTPVEPA